MEIGDPLGQRYETINALVDSGATYTTLPQCLLNNLGVEVMESRAFTLADNRKIERDFGQTTVKIDGRGMISPVVFGDDKSLSLLGAVTLEIFTLGIDPVNGRLIQIDSLA